ncbi:MAG TPA: antitoxin VapB family protein [Candidatus Nanoarchaeia archaeon]|nr:antitoxin VapB family protein [Candidatus Nanoarchaeia archaeon]
MAKTMMISNEAYEKLKKIKHNKSFSEVIISLVSPTPKTGDALLECVGLIKDD